MSTINVHCRTVSHRGASPGAPAVSPRAHPTIPGGFRLGPAIPLAGPLFPWRAEGMSFPWPNPWADVVSSPLSKHN